MSIEQTDKIDIISTTDNDEVVLRISDHLKWNDAENHIALLQDKINTYLHFIEGGQIFEDYPNAKGKKIVITVVMKYVPNKAALLFLEKVKKLVTNIGFGFEWTFFK